MSSLNENRGSYIDNFLTWTTIGETAFFPNNILIIHNISYFRKLSPMADFEGYLNQLEGKFHLIIASKIILNRLCSSDGA